MVGSFPLNSFCRILTQLRLQCVMYRYACSQISGVKTRITNRSALVSRIKKKYEKCNFLSFATTFYSLLLLLFLVYLKAKIFLFYFIQKISEKCHQLLFVLWPPYWIFTHWNSDYLLDYITRHVTNLRRLCNS